MFLKGRARFVTILVFLLMPDNCNKIHGGQQLGFGELPEPNELKKQQFVAYIAYAVCLCMDESQL
jgi:hypothetical protein